MAEIGKSLKTRLLVRLYNKQNNTLFACRWICLFVFNLVFYIVEEKFHIYKHPSIVLYISYSNNCYYSFKASCPNAPQAEHHLRFTKTKSIECKNAVIMVCLENWQSELFYHKRQHLVCPSCHNAFGSVTKNVEKQLTQMYAKDE